jgi:predicted small secreted protein
MRARKTVNHTAHAGRECGPVFHNRRVMTMLKKLVAVLLALAFVPGLAVLGGCNTMQGAGQDIEKAGQKVEKEAAEHKKY